MSYELDPTRSPTMMNSTMEDDDDMGEMQIDMSFGVDEENDPSSPQQDTPSSPQRDTPSSPQRDTPSSPQRDTPSSPQQDTPLSPQTPSSPQQDAPSSPQQDAPSSPRCQAPSDDEKPGPESPPGSPPCSPDSPDEDEREVKGPVVISSKTPPHLQMSEEAATANDGPNDDGNDDGPNDAENDDGPNDAGNDEPNGPASPTQIESVASVALVGLPISPLEPQSPLAPPSPPNSIPNDGSSGEELSEEMSLSLPDLEMNGHTDTSFDSAQTSQTSSVSGNAMVKMELNMGSQEEEDLEDGEIEDDEEESPEHPPVVVKKEPELPPVPVVFSSEIISFKEAVRRSESDKKKSSSRSSSNRKEKEREKSRRKRRAGAGDDAATKKSRQEGSDEDEAFLLVRGGSPSAQKFQARPTPPQQQGQGSFGRPEDQGPKFPEHDPDEENNRRGRRSPKRRDNRREGERKGREDRRKKEDKKTDVICAYYMQGKCQKSEADCAFSHDATPPRKLELCKFWMMECCAKKEKCLYLHNDFPCKFFHTGLICKLADRCKFSHQPLSDVMRNILLKHIETAPKEILGDFPRLTRAGALKLMSQTGDKKEGKGGGRRDKNNGAGDDWPRFQPDEQRSGFSHMDDPTPRRTRWEQPTPHDQEMLQELMEEAGISGFYKETLENLHPPSQGQMGMGMAQQQQQQQPQLPPTLQSHLTHPLLQFPQMPLGPGGLLGSQQMGNPGLASVLASLNMPQSMLQGDVHPQLAQLHQSGQLLFQHLTPQQQQQLLHLMPQPHQVQGMAVGQQPLQNPPQNPHMENKGSLPENLPDLQRELFLRVQKMQMKTDSQSLDKEEEKVDDTGWYSSDEEERGKEKDLPQKKQEQKKKSPDRPVADLDLRFPPSKGSPSVPPFGDTDFRLPPLRQDFSNDIDLRTSNPFKSLPSGTATEINAAYNAHAHIDFKLIPIKGIKKPDYSFARLTVSGSAALLDPRLNPRPTVAGPRSPEPSGPASPPQSNAPLNTAPPTIPGGPDLDPRTRRAQQQQSTAFGGEGFRDPRSASVWPPEMPANTTALAAAQLLQIQQFQGGFVPPGFLGESQQRQQPTSSWERFNQGL